MLTDNSYGLPRPRPLIMTTDEVSPYLDGVLDSVVFDLDATIADSYGGSGVTWANLTATPADGSAQTAYDFFRGDGSSGTTYPTFNGSAGDPAAYWSFDGNDYFKLKSGINTAFLNNLHKTTGGADFWYALTMGAVDFSGGNVPLFGTRSTVNNASHGIGYEVQTSENIRLAQSNGSAGSLLNLASIAISGDHLLIVSYSHSTNQTKFWMDSATALTNAQTFVTSISNPGQAAVIGAYPAASAFLTNGTKIYSAAMGNEYLDDTKAAALIAHLNVRHGRTYA